MGCANIYDWIVQSQNHRQYAKSRLPFTSALAETSTTYGAFVSQVQELEPLSRARYQNEHKRWWRAYGHTWDRIGCVGELEVGEHTQKYDFKPDIPNRRAHMGAPFAGVFGADMVVDKPALEPGYVWCSGPPGGALPVSEERQVTNKFGWTYVVHAGAKGDVLYYLYHDTMTNSDFWACPKRTGASPSNRTDVQNIQRALKGAGYDPGTIDGIWGPKTCQAAYKYKQIMLKENDTTLGPRFWSGLSLPATYIQKYARACDAWYTGDLGPGPGSKPDPIVPVKPPGTKPPATKPPVTDTLPEPVKAGVPVWAGALILGGMLLAAVKLPTKKPRKGKGRRRR